MTYNIGDILICKKETNTQCLEMANPAFNIQVGEKYVITNKDDYPHGCHWYELMSIDNREVILDAWNDEPEHMVLDEYFEIYVTENDAQFARNGEMIINACG